MIKFFVNFPTNGYVTTFGFHLLSSHWGPHDVIIPNLKMYALRSGFLAMVNVPNSQRVLKKYPNCQYMLRFSSYPERLTATTTMENGDIINYRKGENEHFVNFLERIKKGEPVPLKIDWLRIKQTKTVSSYVCLSFDHFYKSVNKLKSGEKVAI